MDVSTTPRTRHTGREIAAFAVVLVATTAVAAYTAAAMVDGSSRAATLLPIALAFGIGLTTLAVVNFEGFLLVVLGLRTSLDALKVNAGTALLDPAAAVGLLLLCAVPIWLLLQHRSGALRFRLTRTGLVVGLFGIAALIGVVVSESVVTSAVEWTRIASAIAMFFAVEQLAIARGGFTWRAIAAVFLAVPVPVVMAVYQISTGTGLLEAAGFQRVTGSFVHSNPLAAFLTIVIIAAIASAILLSGRRRALALVVITAAAPVLLLTYTRGAWLALLVGVVVVALVLRKIWLIGALVAAALALTVLVPGIGDRFSTSTDVVAHSEETVGQDSFAWRIEYWEQALELSQESPFVGVGLRQVAETLPEAKQVHNDFLRAYVELGVLGLIAFTLLCLQFIAVGFRGAAAWRHHGGAVPRVQFVAASAFAGIAAGYVVMSLTANLMSQAVVLLYIMTMAGLASASLVRAQAHRTDPASLEHVS